MSENHILHEKEGGEVSQMIRSSSAHPPIVTMYNIITHHVLLKKVGFGLPYVYLLVLLYLGLYSFDMSNASMFSFSTSYS